MPRNQRRAAAPSRSAPPSRPATTQAHVPAHAPPPPAPVPIGAGMQQQRQPGLFAQMASTAAGVAVGSAVGHTAGAALSGIFGGSGGHPQEAPQQAALPANAQSQYSQQSVNHCEPDQKSFFKCLESNGNDIGACQYYLDAFRACQQAQASFR
ncbi:hypothetical protein SeMB42_g07500 [Synchytrium endobioticum]|uniref:CHCH domain-containing protein n=1 Tax=Synchytrium endobioticum TaxID=286115 RepID=A0A507CLH1_9FUNG|nr:hypothetical protein SeMB42_g07500 [Synchytrium endobioticum]TPX39005.1 hypothetical protein SeLEV6574_g07461 [Synchytrium endobioticum]